MSTAPKPQVKKRRANQRTLRWIGDKGRSAAKSEAIYQHTLQLRRDLLKSAYPDRSLMTYFPAVDQETYAQTPWSIWDFFPASYNCPFEMQRVGAMGDGGKWVCGMSKYIANKAKPCVIYSFGINHESSFGKCIQKFLLWMKYSNFKQQSKSFSNGLTARFGVMTSRWLHGDLKSIPSI